MQIRHNLVVLEKPFFRRGCCVLRAAHHFRPTSDWTESDHDLISLFEHDLFGKPVPTFPDHALAGVVALPIRTLEMLGRWKVYRLKRWRGYRGPKQRGDSRCRYGLAEQVALQSI